MSGLVSHAKTHHHLANPDLLFTFTNNAEMNVSPVINSLKKNCSSLLTNSLPEKWHQVTVPSTPFSVVHHLGCRQIWVLSLVFCFLGFFSSSAAVGIFISKSCWPCISADFLSRDSTNYGSKVFFKSCVCTE